MMKSLKFYKTFTAVVTVATLLLVMAVPSFAAKKALSLTSGTTGGGYYMVAAALAQIINQYAEGVTVNTEGSGGSNENIRLVADKRADLGMGMADDGIAAYEGIRGFSKGAAPHLRVLMAGQTNVFHLIVLEDSKIKTLADLKGKRISLGPAGAPFFGPDLLEAVAGLKKGDYRGQYLGHDQAADALVNGDVDIVIATLTYPAAAYSNLAMTHKLRFLELSQSDMTIIKKKFPFWKEGMLPKGTYNNEQDVHSAAIPVWLYAHEDADPEAIYQVVKAIAEHSDELAKINPAAGEYRKETAIDGVTLPLHPGAERYYKEIGLLKQ